VPPQAADTYCALSTEAFMKIELINHASIILTLDNGRVRLLSDPWFFGTCFDGGWGLKFDNPASMELAKSCTHLWISHFHQDHFHVPTLKKLLAVNPDIHVYGNHSFNFQMDEVMTGLGFKNVEALDERRKLKVNDRIQITRFPTTGIDNMLLIESPEGNILNYNDCNIPVSDRKRLARKIGPIDFLLNNYNHAGKLLDYPSPSPGEIKSSFKKSFVDSCNAFKPRIIVPFASHHFYRAAESQEQNDSLMELNELNNKDFKIVPIGVGDCATFDDDFEYAISHRDEITEMDQDIKLQTKDFDLETLDQAARIYGRKMNIRFLHTLHFLPVLKIRISDMDLTVGLTGTQGLNVLDDQDDYQLICTSESLYQWFTRLYGTDCFIVGAHFDINEGSIVPMQWQFLLGLMTENRVDFRSMIKMLFFPSGIRFLFNRREELMTMLREKSFNTGPRK
jgi:L-ascorbate metabolism protein UlaG (beta-lactamase superfamily)